MELLTNLHKASTGNSLFSGDDLVIKVAEKDSDGNPIVPYYVLGKLYQRLSLFRKKLIQIEQTGHKGNPEKDQIKFEMKAPNGDNLPRGKYRYVVDANFFPHNIFRRGFGDNFEIV